MYEDLIARLRKMSKISAGLSVLLPKAGGNAMAELLEEAADALEEEGNLTADVRPVVLGRWEPSKEHKGYASCSICHDCYVDPEWVTELKWNFCPNCGADMRGDDAK